MRSLVFFCRIMRSGDGKKWGNEDMLADHTWEVPSQRTSLVPREKILVQGGLEILYFEL